MFNMPAMQLVDVRTFVTVADARSVSRAAADLHVTQPAVTRGLQRLEQSLGAELLDRRVRPFALTEYGARALERCRRLLEVAAEIGGLRLDARTPSGELRVGVAHALSQAVLTTPVERQQKQFPRVRLRLQSGWSREILARLKAGSLDAAVLLWPREEPLVGPFALEQIGSETIEVIAPRRAGKAPGSLAEVGAASWVLSPEGCAARQAVRLALTREHLPFRVDVETYNYDLQMGLVARGRGLGAVPRRLLDASRHRERLRRLRIVGLDLPFTLWMVRRESPGPLEPALLGFRDLVAKALRARSPRP